ncbi:MAG: anti-anti-sigma factor [Candidatus Rokuibacteriota bacterium]|nr:MAG: anti-anti-sigma factor [Candidatus Rokubacteria bacterium]
MTKVASRLPDILKRHDAAILKEWVNEQLSVSRPEAMKESALREHAQRFFGLFRDAVQSGELGDVSGPAWAAVREMLGELSQSCTTLGYTPTETATFVLSLKQPLFTRLRQEVGRDAEALADETWAVTGLLDQLGLYTTEVFLKGREDLIRRQQQDMMELSTPVVQLWDNVLALPLIGTLDSARTQIVMENLLHKIVETGAAIAIIDITGVPTVDTLVAQHLLKTVAAARLMGADCIISGIRPQIAQTIVHLGVELANVVTKATLADAFQIALQKTGASIGKATAR